MVQITLSLERSSAFWAWWSERWDCECWSTRFGDGWPAAEHREALPFVSGLGMLCLSAHVFERPRWVGVYDLVSDSGARFCFIPKTFRWLSLTLSLASFSLLMVQHRCLLPVIEITAFPGSLLIQGASCLVPFETLRCHLLHFFAVFTLLDLLFWLISSDWHSFFLNLLLDDNVAAPFTRVHNEEPFLFDLCHLIGMPAQKRSLIRNC